MRTTRSEKLLEPELFYERFVLSLVFSLKIAQVRVPVRNHLQKSASRVLILAILLKMNRKIIYPLGKKRNLNMRRPGILFVEPEFLH